MKDVDCERLTELKAQPDERSHSRTFPPPPIAEHLQQLPHEWLTTFEDMESWRITAEGLGEGVVRRCRYRPLFHESHIEISWTKLEGARIILEPPKPLSLPRSWNAVDFWIGAVPNDYSGPCIECILHCVGRDGNRRAVELAGRVPLKRPMAVDVLRRLVPETLRNDLQGGTLEGIEFRIRSVPFGRWGSPDDAESMLHLYAMTFYTDQFRRTYRRPRTLPFPTHPDGVVPTPAVAGTSRAERDHDSGVTRFVFSSAQERKVSYEYRPATGTLADITVEVEGQEPFCPCVGGGLVFESPEATLTPPYGGDQAALISEKLEGECLQSVWELSLGEEQLRYALKLRMVASSLVVEVQAEGSWAQELRIGHPDRAGKSRAFEVPMLVWDWNLPKAEASFDYQRPESIRRKGGRARSPAVLLTGEVFLSAIFDWYVSDASFVYATAEREGETAGFDGGAYYLPVVDRGRNPLHEKLILTASKSFEAVLPNIPNPPSRYTELMRDRVFSHGCQPLTSVIRHKNLGIQAVATLVQPYPAAGERGDYRATVDQGCMEDWIDDPGPGKGGLQRVVRRAREFRSIGWMIGAYTNYCMMSPVFPCYTQFPPALDSSGFPQTRWPGTMVPATGETFEYLERQSEKIKRRCGFQIIYDDQRTIVPIWHLNDYTPYGEGAGKFRETFEQGAQLYMERAKLYGGPILSEGGMHWMYSGLVDGNLSRVQHNTWAGDDCSPPPDLVDFELRKIHLLTVDNCGNDYFDSWAPEVRDRFICQTLAYGKSGLWIRYTGEGQETQAMSCRVYYTFHLAQKRYRCVGVQEIRYHDGQRLVDTSTILKAGQESRGRIYARYENGFESWTNLNAKEAWSIEVDGGQWMLPPHGWYQRRKEHWGEFCNYSVQDKDDRRRMRVEDDGVLLVVAPDGVMRWDDIETNGTVIVRREETTGTRLINIDATVLRVAASRLALRPDAHQAAYHSFDLEGQAVQDGVVPVRDGWVDFSHLAHEQFALVLP